RLKPNSTTLNAALKRCATQKQKQKPSLSATVESHPFGFAQGRLLRKQRARMGHPSFVFLLLFGGASLHAFVVASHNAVFFFLVTRLAGSDVDPLGGGGLMPGGGKPGRHSLAVPT